MPASTLHTNLLGRRAQIHPRWANASTESPFRPHLDESGEIVAARATEHGVRVLVQWPNGDLQEFSADNLQVAVGAAAVEVGGAS